MKEQYQKEVSQIHVPKELLEKTKQAMKEEEERISGKKKAGKVIPFGKIFMAAAAVLLLVMIPAGAYIYSGEGQSIGEPQLQLGGHADPGFGKIEQGGRLFVKEAEQKPEEFADAEKVIIADTSVFVMTDKETGCLKAYYEKNGKTYVAVSNLTDQREFEKALGEELQ